MEEISIDEVQTQLSALVERAVAGEPFIITKDGQPLVTVSAYEEPKKCPRIGSMKGLISVPEDFDTMMADEIEEMFYGNDDLFANIDPELLKELGFLPEDYDTSKVGEVEVKYYDNDNIFANIDPELLRETGCGPIINEEIE